MIDVNIPKAYYARTGKFHSVGLRPVPSLTPQSQATSEYEDEDQDRPTATEELASYLWDNYIE